MGFLIAIFFKFDTLSWIINLVFTFKIFIWININILLLIYFINLIVTWNEIGLCLIVKNALIDLRICISLIAIISVQISLWLFISSYFSFYNALETRSSLRFLHKLIIEICLLRLLNWKPIFIIKFILTWCNWVFFWTYIVFPFYTFLIAFHFFFFIFFLFSIYNLLFHFNLFFIYSIYYGYVIAFHLIFLRP